MALFKFIKKRTRSPYFRFRPSNMMGVGNRGISSLGGGGMLQRFRDEMMRRQMQQAPMQQALTQQALSPEAQRMAMQAAQAQFAGPQMAARQMQQDGFQGDPYDDPIKYSTDMTPQEQRRLLAKMQAHARRLGQTPTTAAQQAPQGPQDFMAQNIDPRNQEQFAALPADVQRQYQRFIGDFSVTRPEVPQPTPRRTILYRDPMDSQPMPPPMMPEVQQPTPRRTILYRDPMDFQPMPMAQPPMSYAERRRMNAFRGRTPRTGVQGLLRAPRRGMMGMFGGGRFGGGVGMAR